VTAAGGPPEVASPAAIALAIEQLAVGRPPLLVVADFDGTLAVGSRDPASAVIEPLAQRGLRALARIAAARPGRVVVVVLTGRLVADVARRVRVGGVEYLGDHGLEHGTLPRGGRASGIRATSDPAFDVHRDPAEALATGVAETLGHPAWLFVERKGPSVAFHVRQADDVAMARGRVVDAIGVVERRLGLEHGLEHYRGRSVVDLRPRDAGGKREAIERLIDRYRPGALVALGDELSDVDAFEAVVAARSAGAAGPLGVTIAVHGTSQPAPAELLAVADLRLAGPREVGRAMLALARRIEAAGGAGRPRPRRPAARGAERPPLR
jgi:trehalose 6-phosphate phosphatase